MNPPLRRVLGTFDVVLINVVVVFSLRGVTTAAKMGPVSLLLWGAAVLAFFLPLGLVIAELATRDPAEGGFYRWTRAAFGDAHGFLAAWSYWVSNLTYMPFLLIYLSSAASYVFGAPALGERALFIVPLSLAVLWAVTLVNIRGLEAGRFVTGVGAIASWAAAALLIGAGALAAYRWGMATPLDAGSLTRVAGGVPALAYFGSLTFAMVGLELAPVLGDEVKNPRRTLPLATHLAGAGITALYVVCTLAILAAVPPAQISPVSGVFEAAHTVGARAGWTWLGALVAALVGVAVVGGLGAWMAGEARLPLVLGLDRFLPPVFARLHPRYGTPTAGLLVQAGIATVLILFSQAGSSVREAYLLLLDATIVLNFLPFVYIFLSAPRMRPRGDEPGVVRVPGGRRILWLVSGAGLLATLATLASAVIPPPEAGSALVFELKLWGGLLAFGVLGLAVRRRAGRIEP